MDRSIYVKWLAGLTIAIFLGFIAGRQQQLMESQREILSEIQDLKSSPQLVSAETPSEQPDFTMPIENAAVKGDAKAKVVLIEFSDFECPYCGRYVRETYPQIDRDYVATGKIRYVFRHFPLASIHPRAVKAAEAGECARLQGKFWPLHDRLFANQRALERPALVDHARAAGLDVKSFETCLDGQASSAILADLNAGTRAGITGTPTFFLGFAQNDGSVHVVEKLTGAKPYAAFQSVLDRLLTR